MKKYNIDSLTIAQISSEQIDKNLLLELEQRASFEDTDKTLNEVLVSVDTLLNIETESLGRNDELAKEAINLYKQVENFNYIQIAKI